MDNEYNSLTKESIERYLAGQGKLIELMKAVREMINSKNDTDLLEFINTAQFLSVNVFDLLISIKGFITTEKHVEKNLYARVLSTICYQIIKEGRDVTGKKFRNSIINICNNDLDAIKEHEKVRKMISEFDKSNYLYFKEIRNVSIAHRNRNLNEQIEFIEKIDVKKVFQLSADLFVLLDVYNRFLTKFIQLFKTDFQQRLAQ